TFKLWRDDDDARREIAANFRRAADGLRNLHERTGRRVVLCIEPEPFTTFETLGETLEAFALAGEHEHLAVNLDCAHQAVQFETPDAWARALRGRGIRLGKMHLTHALRIPSPGSNPGGIDVLRRLREERYLHQVIAGSPGKKKQTVSVRL